MAGWNAPGVFGRQEMWNTCRSQAMRVPPELYQMQSVLSARFPELRPAQQMGLALWVFGAVLAHSACQSAVLVAAGVARHHAVRQRLREWLYDGADKAKPCAREIAVELCFAPLLRWVLALWQGRRDPSTSSGDPGGRCDHARGVVDRAGGLGALSRHGNPGRLGDPARQHQGAVARSHSRPAAAAACGPAGRAALDRAGPRRPRFVEPAAVARH